MPFTHTVTLRLVHSLEPMSSTVLILVWLLVHLAAYQSWSRVLGSAIIGGAPRWRSAVGLITQVIILPVLKIASMRDDMHACSAPCFSHDDVNATGNAFAVIFPLLMLLDFFLCQLSPLIMAHHLVCILGHLYACTAAQRAFPAYFGGVVALELGSAANGLYCLLPNTFRARHLLVLMTLSNLAALGCVSLWYRWSYDRGYLERVAIVLVSGLLCLARQNDAVQEWISGVTEKKGKN